MRVLTRLLRQAQRRLPQVRLRDHRRAAKRRMLEVGSQRGAQRRAATYRRLLRVLKRTIGYVEAALPLVACEAAPWAETWCSEVRSYLELLQRVVDQTKRRVFAGETVPASEKVVSLFEPHTDIIRKGGRATHYGHKINLTTGRSSLVLDVVVETGNPADSERCLPMLERHVETYGEPPQRVAFDGGYASRANLADAKELGVEHVVFHKKCGLETTDMTPSAWIYGQLKRFRAGVEAGISYLKRCFGLDRCHWRGWEHFQAYVHSACSPTTCCGWFAYCQPDARHQAQLLSSDRFSGAFDGSLCLGRLGRRAVFVSADETTSHARPNHVRLRSIRGPYTPCTRPTASPAGSLLSNSGLLDRNYLTGRWVPHCTIAEGLTPADICITLELARNSRACREVSIHEIGLVQLGPHRVIAVYPVGQPPDARVGPVSSETLLLSGISSRSTHGAWSR